VSQTERFGQGAAGPNGAWLGSLFRTGLPARGYAGPPPAPLPFFPPSIGTCILFLPPTSQKLFLPYHNSFSPSNPSPTWEVVVDLINSHRNPGSPGRHRTPPSLAPEGSVVRRLKPPKVNDRRRYARQGRRYGGESLYATPVSSPPPHWWRARSAPPVFSRSQASTGGQARHR
jgi:hypothetical protein